MLPLQSIRVLDLSRLLPGPFCTMILADFGAEVIKIEDPKLGDYARYYEPKVDEYSAAYHSLNRNKKSVCLDLKTDEGKTAFFKLAEQADIVVESFRPGVMKRLGLDYESLREKNPRLIYCAITGYGQTGPFADMAGHDINYISYAGLLNLMGERNGKPTVPAVQIADLGGGAYPALVGILMALMARETTGKGQFVDISMMEGALSLLQTTLPNYLMANEHVNRGEHMLFGGLACYEVYQTKDNRWLAVGALEPKFWQAFCQGIEREDFIQLIDAPTREQDWMKQEIQSAISKKSLEEWINIFSKLEACVSPVLAFEELIELPQVKARKIIEMSRFSDRVYKQIGIPIKLSETPGRIHSPAPKLGEHTEEILEELGISKRI